MARPSLSICRLRQLMSVCCKASSELMVVSLPTPFIRGQQRMLSPSGLGQHKDHKHRKTEIQKMDKGSYRDKETWMWDHEQKRWGLHIGSCMGLHHRRGESGQQRATSLVPPTNKRRRKSASALKMFAAANEKSARSVSVEHGGTMRKEEHLLFTENDQPPEQNPHLSQRKLLQTAAALPFSPLKVLSNGEPCLLFQARKLSLRYEKQKPLDLTERTFSPQKPADTGQSVCRQGTATLVMGFGDVETFRGLSIRLQLSNTFYESSGQWWFSVDNVTLSYNTSEVAVFNVTDVYAPALSSYRCLHVSSLRRYSGRLLPSSDSARRWSVTFIDFQIQAFTVTSDTFSPASDCTSILTPAILMGLITSLILLLVLAYALHMVIHLKHIENDDDQKVDIYFPHSPEPLDHCCEETITEKNVM